MRGTSSWLRYLLLAYLTQWLTLPTLGQQLKDGARSPQSSSTIDPAACVLRWQEELITCHGINHTQIVADLARIRQQVSREQVAEGRKLEGSAGVAAGQDVSKGESNSSSAHKSGRKAAQVRELSIFGCNVPKLTTLNLDSPSSLEILSVVNSGVKEVRPDAFLDHEQSLTRLVLAHNSLQALPEALLNLTKLEVLDLSNNEIDHLPEGTLFFHLHRLRQLHLDHNKLGQILGAQARLGLRSPGLSLAVFNLEPLRESLTHLTLSHNDITAFPEQFSRPFTRLTSLDLSSNAISEILPDGFHEMPRLQHLDLSGNLLKEFSPQGLVSSILDLNLKGNPWTCSCNSKWILESLQTNRSESTKVTPPTCSSPLYLRHQELVSLKEIDLCPPEGESVNNKVIFIGDDVDGSLNHALKSLHLLNVTVLNHQALIISWRVDGDFYNTQNQSSEPLSWAVTLHKTSSDPRLAKVTRMKLERYKQERPDWRPSESLYTELLHGLEEDTHYTLCLVPVQDDHLFTRPDHCKYVTTPEEEELQPATPTTSPAPVTSTTSSTTTREITTESPKAGLLVSTEDYEVMTEQVIMSNEARRILMSWNVTIHIHSNINNHVKREAIMLQPLGWKITYRKFAEENETEIVLVSRGGEPVQNFTNHYTVDHLEPGTGYTFCFRPLSNTEVQASLIGKNREDYDMAANLHSFTLHSPEVISSAIRSQHPPENHISEPISNSIDDSPVSNLGNEVDRQTTTEPNYPDYEESNIPANIPPVPSIRPQSIPANIPPLPNFQNFDRRPPRPPPQSPGGNFVFTSTGERISLPSASSGSSSPFSLPSIVGPSVNFSPSQHQQSSASSNHPILNIPRDPQQRFTYDFDDSTAESSPRQTFTYDFTTEATTTRKPQQYTYVTRRKRSVHEDSKVIYEKQLDSGLSEYCKEVVTLGENRIIAPVAIASAVSTSTTVIIAIIFCCCCPKRCRKKKANPKWHGRTGPKVSTTNPMPASVYIRQNSVISSTTIGAESNGDLKSLPSQVSTSSSEFNEGGSNNPQLNTGRSISVTSSTGYLTPIVTGNGVATDPGRVFNEAKSYLPSQKAYLNSVKDRLLQQHKDLKDFHPGYDIPPTSSIKSLLGYDYPHPIPVNAIGTHTDSAKQSKTSIPSPSSSDSNYNASISDQREAEVNLNIPFTQNKSSDSSKKFNLNRDPDLNKSIDYNYINPDDVNNKPRAYIKNGPLKIRHRKFGSPQRLPDEPATASENSQETSKHGHSNGSLQSPPHLSRSVPDLATVGKSPEGQASDIEAAARLNLLIGSQMKGSSGQSSLPPVPTEERPSKLIIPSVSAEDLSETDGYVNFPPTLSASKDQKQNKDKDHYHTWSSSRPNTPRSRPSLGEVVLTGGTLIEVPEGYVIPKPPKPTRSVRLLVPGEDKPILPDKGDIGNIEKEYTPPPMSPKENKVSTFFPNSPVKRDVTKSKITQLVTPELDENRIVISTGMAV